jgi:predicted dehydrogenase
MKKLRIGLLGCGRISGRHINCIAERDDAEITAVCDTNPECIEAFQKQAQETDRAQAAAFSDPEQMYEQTDLDAVIICTPHTMHFEHAMTALEKGLHVFLEKPMVTCSEHAYKLAAKAEETGKIVTVGYNTSATPVFSYLRCIINEGRLGKLELVNGYICQNWLEGTRGGWRQDPALSGGGQAYDSGAHLMNSLVWSVNSQVSEVYAMVDNHGSPVDINSTLTVRFENGVMAGITIGGNCSKMGGSMVFIFEKGRVEIDGWGGGWIKVFADNEAEEPELDDEKLTPTDNFIDALQGFDTVRVTPEHGIIHSELMDAVYRSSETGEPVRFREKVTV